MPTYEFDNLVFKGINPGDEILGLTYLGNSRFYSKETSPELEESLKETKLRAEAAGERFLEMFGSYEGFLEKLADNLKQK